MADAVRADPALPLRHAAGLVPAARRTLERLFRAETGMTPAAWHRRARILAAIASLEGGASVTATALRIGYLTPSSFVAAFRAELGHTPRAFLRPRPAKTAGGDRRDL